MKKGNVFLGVLAGLAAGAILGVLFAPAKGSETRRKILEKGDGYADALKEKFDGLLNDLLKKPSGVQEEDHTEQ